MTHIPGVHNYFTRIDRLNGGERVARLHACTTRIGHVCIKPSIRPSSPSTPIPEHRDCQTADRANKTVPLSGRSATPRFCHVMETLLAGKRNEEQPNEICNVKCVFRAFENPLQLSSSWYTSYNCKSCDLCYSCVTKNRNGSEWTKGEREEEGGECV